MTPCDDNDIVISGQSFRLPGVDNLSDLSKKLNGSVSIHPNFKFKIHSDFTGYDDIPDNDRIMDKTECMDVVFCGMSKAVADCCNCSQRKLIALCYEALLDAGINLKDVEDIICEVYQSTSASDGEVMRPQSNTRRGNYLMTGASRALEANRVSFFFNSKGSSVSTDFGNCGGLGVIQLAYQDIKNGRADMAVVCGSNLAINFETSIQYDHLGVRNKKEETRVFDNDATGYQRSMGLAAFVLQRSCQAKRIYAKIQYVRIQNERVFFKQTPEIWESVLTQSYEQSKIPLDDIAYLEPYCCGMKEMDAAELNAISNTMCKGRKTPLLIGSIKSNVGHAEGCADYVSILKALSIFETGIIPANEHYRTPNSQVPALVNGQLEVVDSARPFPDGLIAINSYSIGGTVGHLVLKKFNKVKATHSEVDIPRLIPLSARTENFITNNIALLEKLPYDPELNHMLTDIFQQPTRKNLGKGYVILKKDEIPISKLTTMDEETKRPVWFMFSGMGSQWLGMGTQLMKIPLIRESLERSHRALEPKGMDLIHVLTTDDSTIFDNILYAFVGISAIQVALVDLMRALKVKPDGVIGHSLGEQSCAYASGCLTAEQTILAAYCRGRASLAVPLIKGMMAAVGMGYNQIKDELPDGVEVACHNSSSSCTLSGPAEIIAKYVDQLTERKVFARAVNVGNIAYHSAHIKPAANYLRTSLTEIIPEAKPRPANWISTSIPEDLWDSELAQTCSAEYLTNNLTSSVLLEEACNHIPENAILIEFAPHGLLQAIVKRSMKNAVHLSLTNKQAKDSVIFLLEALGSAFMAGVEMDINVLYPGVEYPLSRGTYCIPPFIHWVDDPCATYYTVLQSNRDVNIRHALAAVEPSMEGMKIADQKVFPISTYIHLFEEQLSRFYKNRKGNHLLQFNDLRFEDNLHLPINSLEWLEEFHSRALNSSELVTRDGKLVAKGYSYVLGFVEISSPLVSNDDRIVTIPKEELYKWFTKQGYVIPVALQALNYIAITNKGLIASIPSHSSRAAKIEALLQVVTFDNISKGKSIIFPRGIRELTIDNSINCYKKDEDLDVLYDRALGSVTCRGLYMSGVQFETVIPQETPLSFHSHRIVPFKTPEAQSSTEFVDFCWDLVQDSQQFGRKVKAVNFIGESGLVTSHIEKNQTQIEVTKCNISGDVETADYDLVVCGKQQLPKIVNSTSNYILVQGSGPIIIPVNFVNVSMFTSEKDQLWLLKKKIILTGERDFIAISDKKEDLIANLQSRGKKSVLVVGFKEPAEGLMRYRDTIQSQVKANIKWLLVLDADAPQFNVDTPLYREQLEIGLPVNILLNGQWHFNMNTRICGSVNEKNGGTNMTSTQQVEVIPEVKVIENKRTMGIIKKDSDVLDDVLSWPVPASWNQADITSIPTAYSLAYYCFKVAFQVENDENVLVTDGLSELGQAAIAVALSMAGRVFASVASKEEANQLMALFPQVKPDDIILHNDKHFALRLRYAIRESHPEIIYNTLEGDQFKCCLDAINQFGKMFHFGREEIKKNTIVGMAIFLKGVSLYCLSHDSPRRWSKEDKMRVQKLVSEGIRNGVVKPRNVGRQLRLDGLETQQQPAAKRQNGSLTTLNSTSTYVVVGEASDLDVDVAEWLARNGAKNITICNTSSINNPNYQRKIKTLQLHRNVNIQTVEQLALKKHIKDNNVHAVFLINMAAVSTKNHMALFEDFLRPEIKSLVTISRGRDYVLKMAKLDKKMPTCSNIIWETSEDQLLGQSLDLVAPYLSHHSTISVSQDILYKSSWSRLNDILPETQEKYQNLGQSLKTKPELVPLITRVSARRCDLENHDVTPIIVLPGLQDDPVRLASQLVKETINYAYVATSPAIGLVSIASTANSLVQLIKTTLPRKTYNLVGVSTGCALALEVTRQLERQGSIVFLLLLENPTFPLQKALRTEVDLQNACLDSLSSFATNGVDDSKMKCLTWSARLSHVVSCLDGPPSLIPKAATYIYDTINALLCTDFTDFKVKGPLTVVRSKDSRDDYNYNKMTVNNLVVDVPVPSSALLSSPDVKKILNVFIGTESVNPTIAHQIVWEILEEILKWDEYMKK